MTGPDGCRFNKGDGSCSQKLGCRSLAMKKQKTVADARGAWRASRMPKGSNKARNHKTFFGKEPGQLDTLLLGRNATFPADRRWKKNQGFSTRALQQPQLS